MTVRRKHALRRPKDGTVPDRGDDDPSLADALGYEAFGRVMAALATEADFIEWCRDLTWWRGADRSWHIEWRDGPYASEVAALLAGKMPDPGPGPDDSSLAVAGPGDAASAVLEVMGVRFELRAVDPMGRARVRARPGLWRLAEALDTTRRTNTRHPWEELLGG
ncbi:hypothetical protein ACIBIZ_39880 [Nonomuraea spiralis]|uniref:Uncharacterized protein n=1 Tax=Nonomuraea spiralis TaxID=46182 RepID=A0ABV5IWL3_9ACTN|nr:MULTISPECIES: hypothetical protein [Nonomuraea]RSM96535.1 hypothetical protein DMB42_47535 [Nonomuraea sp. WAC 01424]GGT31254.1 hypothetical protein GCM10010176_089840 [Nonomuraea spiralis]